MKKKTQRNWKKNLQFSLNAIPCDFQYEEYDPDYPYKELERIDLNYIDVSDKSTDAPSEAFSCEETHATKSTTPRINVTQTIESDAFDASLHESHDYEDIESTCLSRRRTIQPKALNNIYNKLTKVVNTNTFVQSINLEECL
jgi:hypothetical protein